MMEKKFVYVVLFDYSTDDCSGIDLYIFDTKEKALKKLDTLIEQEKEFYKNEYPGFNDFKLDTNIKDANANEYWWNYKCESNYYLHTFIDLKIMEVN